MNLQKSGYFISDLEKQFQWYVINANWEIADRYLDAVETTCKLLERYPLIGPRVGFSHARLRDWRFVVVFRPFQKHVLFYEVVDDNVLLRRAMHGHQDFPRRLIEPET